MLPAFASRDLIQNLIFLFYMLALAQCWNLLAGYAGLISVGQQAFVGFGGYLSVRADDRRGIDPLLAIPVVGVVSAALALPTALIVFRLRGAYFAIGTWVVAEVYRLVFAQFKLLGGGTGTSLPTLGHHVRARHRMGQGDAECAHAGGARHHFLLAGAGAGGRHALLVYLMLRSRRGLALGAIRDNEAAAASAASTSTASSSVSMC